jgi:hypothetical protein
MAYHTRAGPLAGTSGDCSIGLAGLVVGVNF